MGTTESPDDQNYDLFCSFCGKHQKEVKKLVAGGAVYICDECIELTSQIMEDDDGTVRLRRTITFPPEYCQAGISILNYFSKIVSQKYPDTEASITIEQHGNSVTMIIETNKGERERVERTLDDYGMVVMGHRPPEHLLSEPLEVITLKHKLELTALELKMNKEIHDKYCQLQDDRINTLEDQINNLNLLIGHGMSSSNNLLNLFQSFLDCYSYTDEIKQALRTIIDGISKEYSPSVEKSVKGALLTIKGQEPGLFEKIDNIIQGTISGASGSVLGSWLLAILNSLPK